jgi:hypothetical protein
MGLFKRSGSRRARSGPEHPVYGLRVRMDREDVIARLGPPPKAITGREYFATYKRSLGGTPDLDHETWLYENVPSQGYDIQISIAAGMLNSVKVVDTQQHRTVWSLP